MPTKQEQGDLNGMLYGGHGEIPRFVLAPTNIAECFHKTVEAFNLAEKYQIPVYLTGDLALAVTEQTFEPEEFDMDAVEIDRGKVVDEETIGEWQNEKGQFKPHALTDDGISPRSFPGTAGGAHMSTGLEHDELGRRTEDTGMRIEQVDKRDRKVETAREREGLGLPGVRRRRRRHARRLVGIQRGRDAGSDHAARRGGHRRSVHLRPVHLPATGPHR